MRVTLVYRAVESLGLENLSALLKTQGHAVTLVFDPDLFGEDHYLPVPALRRRLSHPESVAARVRATHPDVVGFSVPTPYFRWALDVARGLDGIPVVFGGIHPSSVPNRVLAHDVVDIVLTGESDHSFPRLLAELDAGDLNRELRTPGAAWRDPRGTIHVNPEPPPVLDLDALPLPDKALFEDVVPYREQYRTVASRGCTFQCTYCCHSRPHERDLRNSPHPAVRRMSVARVMTELRQARQRYRPWRVHFDDEVFTSDRRWTRSLCDAYKAEFPRTPFSCVTHPAFMTDEIARWLKQAGCVMVELGVQSLDPQLRRDLLHRYEPNALIERALDACHSAGLVAQVDHILGLPDETEHSALQAARFYARYGGSLRVALFHLTYYPGTAITGIARDRGWLDAEHLNRIEEGLEGSIYTVGSVGDSSLNAALQALFRVMPLAPGLGRRLIDGQGWRHLARLPWMTNVALEAATAWVNRDPRALAYAELYARHLARGARRALRHGGAQP